MLIFRLFPLGVSALAGALLLVPPPAHAAGRTAAGKTATDLSGQARRGEARARTRIEVRPLRRAGAPLRRECVPVFEERLIPQWGGRVLYASQQCWWTR